MDFRTLFSHFGYILSYYGMTEENVGNGAKFIAFAVRVRKTTEMLH
jgi:hypothetical protein